MKTFQNIPIDITDLPQVGEMEYKKLHPNYFQVSIISRLIQYVFFLGAIITGLSFAGYLFDLQIFLGALGAWAFLLTLSLSLTWIGFRFKAYALREKDVHYRRGVLWRSETSIPFHRVQHVEVSEGFVERMFKLASLRVFTAGGESSDLSIPGLEPDHAKNLKAYILKKSELVKEEGDDELSDEEVRMESPFISEEIQETSTSKELDKEEGNTDE
ncbi:MAG: PH domain-containing protein [Bacteroidota bacterium]